MTPPGHGQVQRQAQAPALGLGHAQASHPRRPPAHRSVSLLHAVRQRHKHVPKDRSDSSSEDALVKNGRFSSGRPSDSPSSLLPLGRDSSGESSNADKWFEKSNNEVRDSTSFADNDPPFFMRNSSSSETPPQSDVRQQSSQFLNPNPSGSSLPLRAGLLRLGTDGSSTEDFRSVIDDLTIENKKLKRRLKKYEKLHDSHLRDEKLFEVRIHGLAPEKKRELEETLRKFASSLGTGFPANGYGGLLPMLKQHNTASSHTSIQNPDSAYASMSVSAQGSSGLSGNEIYSQAHKASSATSRQQNIHSYLHHIPEGISARTNPANMTERAKKKMVARRLEQIFVGKGAALGGHQHSLQQQDVSQMAARADQLAGEAQGQLFRGEGSREARIMEREFDDPTDASRWDANNTSPDDDSSNSQKQNPTASATDLSSARKSEPPRHVEQRPTRPLDLNPQRAQVPADNFRYMRHLGFSPPTSNAEEGHGWVYLNLLINMAQLHTLCVTTEFVRKAVTEYSSKFEISEDGRKVRWKGSPSLTRTSSSGEASSPSRADMDILDGQSPRKRPKLAHRTSAQSARPQIKSGAVSALRSQAENNKLVYTPLFFHRDSTDDTDDSSEEEEENMTSPFPAPVVGTSSGMTSSGMRTTLTRRVKKQDDGPIIFYNNARFCTDLSGDRRANGNADTPPYVTATSIPVGGSQVPKASMDHEKRGPLAEAFELPEPMDLSDNPIPESLELAFPQRSPLRSDDEPRIEPFDLEVTGIGGVWPADNFALAVARRYTRVDSDDTHSTAQDACSERLPTRFAKILKEVGSPRKARSTAHMHYEIVAVRKKDLPPSKLPPALSFMPFDDGSQGDDESDLDDGMSISPESPGAMPPSAAPQPVELHYTSSDEDDDEDDDDESEGSLDLLAAAREVDPEAILAREREYDANMAERLAEDIPAGSSAATAGGGSGFASPANGVNREEYKKAMRDAREARQKSASLKRTRTNDSMKVQGPPESVSSEDQDDDEDEEMSSVAS